MKKFRKICALVLSLAMLLTMFASIPFVTNAATGVIASKLVTNDYGTYVEHNGKPYLMYGIQLRIDRQYLAKISQTGVDDWDWIEENLRKAAEDGFKTVAIPIYWSHIITGNYGEKSSAYLEKMYEYVYKYDLTVQWLWFGSNVCGQGDGTAAWDIIGVDDSERSAERRAKYSHIKKIIWDTSDPDNLTYTYSDEDSPYFDFTDEDTMLAEQEALAYMMECIAEIDTEKRCVMIQLNNEIDQGGDYWLPKDENGNILENWWDSEELHDKYCYAFGQRDALFAQLDALGDVVHNSSYSCVTRVNLSDACRPNIANDDYTDLLAYDGIDIVGIDCYKKELTAIEERITEVDGNVTHLAESAADYDNTVNTAILLENGIGNFIYCHRSDDSGGSLYQQDKNEDGSYNTLYKEWVERETTPAIRAYNAVINKAYEKIANAVSVGEFAASDDILTASEMNTKLVNTGAYTLSGDTLTSVAGKDSASAMFVAQQDFVLDFNAKVTASNLQVRIRNKDVTGHSVGYRVFIYPNKISLQKFNDNNWASTEIASADYDFTKSVAVRIVANGTNLYVSLDGVKKMEIKNAVDTSAQGGELRFYGMAGAGAGVFRMVSLKECSDEEDVSSDLLVDTNETLENGDKIYKVSAAGNVTVAENVKNFSLEFNYKDVYSAVTNPENLNVSLRGGAYTLYIHRWASDEAVKSHWMSFAAGSNGTVGGNHTLVTENDEWTAFKIVMYEKRVAIFVNGVLWQAIDLKDDAVAGDVEFVFSNKYETYMSDIVFTTDVTEQDTYYAIDAALDSEVYHGFKSIKNTAGDYFDYDATVGGVSIKGHFWSNKVINVATDLKEYVFETDLQYGQFSNVRGFGFTSPTGYRYLFIDANLYVYDASGSNIATPSYKLWNNNTWVSIAKDGKFHNIKIRLEDGVETVYMDNTEMYTVEVGELTAGGTAYLFYNLANNEIVYHKNMKLANAIITDDTTDDNDDNTGGNTGGNEGGGDTSDDNNDDTSNLNALAKALVASGAYTASGDVLNSVLGKEGTATALTKEQNFVFDFNVKINTDSAANDHLQLRLRSNDISGSGIVGHSVGYRLFIYKDRISIQKFNDDNWQSTEIKSVDHNFTETTKVRIAANGSDLWIALNGVKQIILTDAVDTSAEKGALRFYGMKSQVVSEVMPVALTEYSEAANDGVTTPVVDETVIKTPDELTKALIRTTAYTLVDGNLVKSVAGLSARNAILTDSQDFILNFNMKLDSTAFNEYIQVRLRCADLKGHSVGYRLYFYKDRVQLEKFNEDNWNSTKIDTADHDFTKMSKVRIVADGKNIWIAVDDEKLLSITDAIDTSADKGELRFYGAHGESINAEVEMVSLKKYSDAAANEGIKPEDPSKKNEIKSANEILNALVRSGAYIRNGDLANNVGGMDSKSASITDAQDFIFNFKLKFASDGSGSLQIRLRSKDLKSNSTGYRLFIYKNKIQLDKFKDNSWASEAIASVKHDFTETSDVRIVAHGTDLWVAINGERVINITNAVSAEGGEIRFYGMSTSALCEITPVSLMLYDEATALDGITEAEPEVEDDKAIAKPMVQGALNNIENGDSSVWTIIIVVGVAVLAAAVLVAVVLIIKKKKNN